MTYCACVLLFLQANWFERGCDSQNPFAYKEEQDTITTCSGCSSLCDSPVLMSRIHSWDSPFSLSTTGQQDKTNGNGREGRAAAARKRQFERRRDRRSARAACVLTVITDLFASRATGSRIRTEGPSAECACSPSESWMYLKRQVIKIASSHRCVVCERVWAVRARACDGSTKSRVWPTPRRSRSGLHF